MGDSLDQPRGGHAEQTERLKRGDKQETCSAVVDHDVQPVSLAATAAIPMTPVGSPAADWSANALEEDRARQLQVSQAERIALW